MRIKLNEQKILEFNIDTAGCSWEDLKAYLRFTFNNVEYGFQGEVKEEKIRIKVPPFEGIISESLVESISKNREIIVKGRLDIVAEGDKILTPWDGDVEIEIPVSIRIQKNKEGMKDLIEASKDLIKVKKEPTITTVSTAEENPEPFDKVLKTAKKEADKKSKETVERERRSRFGKMLMGDM